MGKAIVALVTPFKTDLEIDWKALSDLIEWHIQEGTDGLVLSGTTGEAPTLSEEEQLEIFSLGVELAKKRILIIAGTGTNDTRKTVKRTEAAKKIGVDMALVVVPYYNRPSPEGTLAHFRGVAEVGLPFITYNHPGRCGLALSAETLREISTFPNAYAIKESSGGLELIKQLEGITVFSGDDSLTIPMMELGGSGIISVVGNLIPRQWKEMTLAFDAGDLKKAKEISNYFAPLCETMFLESNPQCVKFALSLLGKCQPVLRLPMVIPRLTTRMRIEAAVKQFLPDQKSSLAVTVSP